MASTQSGAVANLYRQWRADPAPDDPIFDNRQWDVLTAEPGAVDYLETDADGSTVLWAVPHGCAADRVLLCVHGGGFIGGSVHTHRKMFGHLAKAAGTRALLVSYPLLPQGVHPAPVDQVAASYRWLLGQGVEAGHVAFVGDSAGGGLAVTAQLRAREWGLPLPAAALLISAWVDMEVTGATMRSNSSAEALFTQQGVRELAQGFLGGADPRDPLASPLHADLTGFGPLHLQVGGAEVLLDDSRRLAEHAEKAGVEVLLDVFPEQQHTFQMMAGRAPEADDAIGRFAAWVRPLLGL
ncbi:alpha/beta hydrolase [Streptomyces sp. NPDC051976]|uniref:alpha/beta hydrolase n=1 Tax=Streptomyces sp. NPDC051976 TaxID=3154947 RepID=UPI00342FBCAD